MTMYHLSGKSFELSQTSQEFLDSYIKRLKTYITVNHISETYLEDIIERITEKLMELEKNAKAIKNGDVIQIVNDIGEPEDIFPIDNTAGTKKNPTKTNNYKPFRRSRDGKIIAGVCAGIAKNFQIDPLWVRLIFIALIFLGSMGIWLYLICAFLMPMEVENGKMPTSKNAETKNEAYVQNSGMMDRLSSVVGSGFRGIFRIFLMVIFAAIGLGFTACFIGGTVVSGLILSGGFVLSNQEFLGNIPQPLLIAVPLLTVLALVMALVLFANIIGKNLFGQKGWLTVGILTAVGFILLSTGVVQTLKEYSWAEQNITETSFAFTGKTLNILNDLYGGEDNLQSAGNIRNNTIIRKVFGTNTVNIRITDRVQSKDQSTAKYILSSLNALTYTFSGNVLSIKRPEKTDFKNLVPFGFPTRFIEISVSENIQIEGRGSLSIYNKPAEFPKNRPAIRKSDDIELPLSNNEDHP